MDIFPEDMVQESKDRFRERLDLLLKNFGSTLETTALKSEEFLLVQSESVQKLCLEVDKGITASEEFRMHCQVLIQEFQGIEELAARVREMRKGCEELEKKLARRKIE
jgi:hypothetical protein